MILYSHEMRRGKLSLLIWTISIASMLVLCVLIYPEMATQMEGVSEMFADMGGFTRAFGMDQLNFGEFIGFFGVECGNVLGLGGALYAASVGISALAKEEKEHTAEFLLTHPISRTRVVAEKLCAVLVQVIVLNIVVVGVTILSIIFIDEEIPVDTLALLFVAYGIMQIEIAVITFGISAFLKRSGLGIGLGLAAVFYFLNIIANLTENAKFLKYITPFGYAESSEIIAEGVLNKEYLTVGGALMIVSIVLAFFKYRRKDI